MEQSVASIEVALGQLSSGLDGCESCVGAVEFRQRRKTAVAISYLQLHIQTNIVVRIVPAKQASSHKPQMDSVGIR
ncbi:MAG: hypothetical protein Aurels2KO_00720 [Aureliella sp.]